MTILQSLYILMGRVVRAPILPTLQGARKSLLGEVTWTVQRDVFTDE